MTWQLVVYLLGVAVTLGVVMRAMIVDDMKSMSSTGGIAVFAMLWPIAWVACGAYVIADSFAKRRRP